VREAVISPGLNKDLSLESDDGHNSEEPSFLVRLKDQLLRANVEVVQSRLTAMQDDIARSKAAFEKSVKEQLSDKVALSSLKDHLNRNRDQKLYANVTKCQQQIEELRKGKVEVTELPKHLQAKADKSAVDGLITSTYFKTIVEQFEFRVSEVEGELRKVKITAAASDRTTAAAIRDLKASVGVHSHGMPQPGGMSLAQVVSHVTGMSPIDGGALMPPRPPGAVGFPSLEGPGPVLRRDQSERTLSPKRAMSKRNLASSEGPKKKAEPTAVEVSATQPTATTTSALPSLAHLLFKVEPDEYKALKAATEKDGKPLVTPRPPQEDK
jgi:hypothetical protein